MIIKLGLIKLFDQRVDICDELKQVGEACPLSKGVFELQKEVDIPGGIPPGTFSFIFPSYSCFIVYR